MLIDVELFTHHMHSGRVDALHPCGNTGRGATCCGGCDQEEDGAQVTLGA